MEQYTVDYFIDKFSNIPDNRWAVGECCDKKGKYCAFGYCGEEALHPHFDLYTKESQALILLFANFFNDNKKFDDKFKLVYHVNDGWHTERFGLSPKERILTVLKMIKDGKSDL